MRKVRLSKSCLGEEEIALVTKVLKEEYLGMGSYTQIFERNLADFFGREAVCTSTGTGAVQLGLQAAGIQRGDEVLVQSLTYVATYQAITAVGAIPISCEIDPATLTIDLKDAKAKVSSRTKAIVPVHYAGGMGDLDGIYNFAKSLNLRVVEDAAHALGSYYKNQKIGSTGDVVCFSFDGIKNITSGEGGCITSSDPAVLKRIKDLRLLSVENDTEKRYLGQRSWSFDVHEQGWRYHMSNIMAAIGIEQLKKLPQFSKIRKALAKRYVSNLKDMKYLSVVDIDYSSVTPHIFVIRFFGDDVDAFREDLERQGIQTGKHYYPNHFLTYFKEMYECHLPKTEQMYKELVTLPLHAGLNIDDVDYVCEKIKSFMKRYE